MNFNDLLLPDLASYTSEKEYAEAVLDDLSPYFHVHREVSGRYPTGEGVRLDAVLRPRDPGPWFDDVRQAVDYSYCDFDGYGRIGIFLCPSPVVRHLRMARDVIEQHAVRVAEEHTIEYHRRWVASTLRATRSDFTEAELEHEAKKQLWKRKRQLRDIEAGAVAEGFRGGAAQRTQNVFLNEARFLVRMIGGFGVGELMQYRSLGWTLARSGGRLWSQYGEPVRHPWRLRPKFGGR